MMKGATDYLAKPLNLDEVDLIAAPPECWRRESGIAAEGGRAEVEDIIGRSPMVEVLIVKQVALSRATVLIQGESGTGKESRRDPTVDPGAMRPWRHCVALFMQLLESELFGHEGGSRAR